MPGQKESLHAKLEDEVRSALHLTLYFGIWFCALNLLVHETQGRSGLPLEAWGFAWVKAAICAKFLLVGQLIVPMPDISKTRLWSVILPRSFVYLLVVILLSLVEEGIKGMLHGQHFFQGVSEFAGGDPMRFFALAWVYWLILVPYLVVSGLLAPSTAPQSAGV